MDEIRCISIDDNPDALTIMEKFVDRTDGYSMLGTFTNAYQALSFIKSGKVDVIFLDQEMPDICGLEFLDLLQESGKKQPYIIFTSGHTECAVQTYEHYNVVSFLEKPICFNKFLRAIHKLEFVLEQAVGHGHPSVQNDFIFFESRINNKKQMHRVRYQDLISMESSGDNALIKTEKTSFIIRTPLVDLERELPEAMFSRIQKSYIVNIGRIEKIIHGSKRVLLDNGDEVPFGKQYYEMLLAKVSTKIYKERN